MIQIVATFLANTNRPIQNIPERLSYADSQSSLRYERKLKTRVCMRSVGSELEAGEGVVVSIYRLFALGGPGGLSCYLTESGQEGGGHKSEWRRRSGGRSGVGRSKEIDRWRTCVRRSSQEKVSQKKMKWVFELFFFLKKSEERSE